MRVARCPLQQFSLCCAVISVEADDQSVDSPYTGSSERASVGRQGGRRLSYRERCPCFVRAVECPIAWDRINRRCGLEQRDALWARLWVSDAEKNERDSSAHERFFFFFAPTDAFLYQGDYLGSACCMAPCRLGSKMPRRSLFRCLLLRAHSQVCIHRQKRTPFSSFFAQWSVSC